MAATVVGRGVSRHLTAWIRGWERRTHKVAPRLFTTESRVFIRVVRAWNTGTTFRSEAPVEEALRFMYRAMAHSNLGLDGGTAVEIEFVRDLVAYMCVPLGVPTDDTADQPYPHSQQFDDEDDDDEGGGGRCLGPLPSATAFRRVDEYAAASDPRLAGAVHKAVAQEAAVPLEAGRVIPNADVGFQETIIAACLYACMAHLNGQSRQLGEVHTFLNVFPLPPL